MKCFVQTSKTLGIIVMSFFGTKILSDERLVLIMG